MERVRPVFYGALPAVDNRGKQLKISEGMIKLKRTSARMQLEYKFSLLDGSNMLQGTKDRDAMWRVKISHPTQDRDLWLRIHLGDGNEEQQTKKIEWWETNVWFKDGINTGLGYFYLIYAQVNDQSFPAFAVPCSESAIYGNIYAQWSAKHTLTAKRAKTVIRRARSDHMGEDGTWQEHRQSHEETDLAAAMRNVYLVNLVDLGGLVCPGRI